MAIEAYGLIVKKTSFGVVVLYPESKEKLLLESNDNHLIRLVLVSKNRNFFNFTELDHDLNNQRYYITNKEVYRTQSETPDYVLHQGKYLNENQLVFVGNASTSIQKLFGIGDLKISSDKGEIEVLQSSDQARVLGEILADDFGVYQVISEDYPEGIKLMYGKEITPRSFIIVDFHIGGDYLKNRQQEQQRIFLLKLNNRKAYWRFYFIEQDQILPALLEIFDGKTKLKISGFEEVTLINNKKAVVATLSDPMPLFYQYKDLKLLATIGEKISSSTPNTIKLSSPISTRIKAFGERKERAYLVEMYITYKLKS